MLPPVDVLLAFGLVVVVLTITPGLDTALVLRSAATAGTRAATGVIIGVSLGVLAWGALAAAGVSAVLLASPVAYEVLRWAGVVYLVWIGARMIAGAIRGRGAHDAPSARGRTLRSGIRQGALTNLLNPKVGAFYVAVLPQFIPPDAVAITWGVALAAVHVLLGAVWLGMLLAVARAARRWLERPRVVRAVDGTAGAVIVGFGAALALGGSR